MLDSRYQYEFHRLVASIITQSGNVVRTDSTAFGVHGWDDTTATSHLRQCGFASHGIPYDGEWEERPSLTRRAHQASGFIVKSVTCKCGLLHDRKVRMECDALALAERVFMTMKTICDNLHQGK